MTLVTSVLIGGCDYDFIERERILNLAQWQRDLKVMSIIRLLAWMISNNLIKKTLRQTITHPHFPFMSMGGEVDMIQVIILCLCV